VPVHKRMACGDQKVCIIGEMENYVATMLHAQKFTARRTTLSVLRSLDMLRAGCPACWMEWSFFTVKHPKARITITWVD
jgi:hypothetical protein